MYGTNELKAVIAPPGGGMLIISKVSDPAVTSDVACVIRGTVDDVETIIEVNFDMANVDHAKESVDGGPNCTLPGT